MTAGDLDLRGQKERIPNQLFPLSLWHSEHSEHQCQASHKTKGEKQPQRVSKSLQASCNGHTPPPLLLHHAIVIPPPPLLLEIAKKDGRDCESESPPAEQLGLWEVVPLEAADRLNTRQWWWSRGSNGSGYSDKHVFHIGSPHPFTYEQSNLEALHDGHSQDENSLGS